MRQLAAFALIALAACGRGDKEKNEETLQGELCGIPGIEGREIADVNGRGSCGIEDPVAVTRVSGVALSRPARMTCETASALNTWVSQAAKPILLEKGGGLARLEVAAGYACRTRNSRRGARLSEHARGKAIDISAFTMRDGSSLTVSRDWRSGNSATMKKLHSTACGPFGTVLGPNSDRHHQNHFHFDTADYRSGPYCR